MLVVMSTSSRANTREVLCGIGSVFLREKTSLGFSVTLERRHRRSCFTLPAIILLQREEHAQTSGEDIGIEGTPGE